MENVKNNTSNITDLLSILFKQLDANQSSNNKNQESSLFENVLNQINIKNVTDSNTTKVDVDASKNDKIINLFKELIDELKTSQNNTVNQNQMDDKTSELKQLQSGLESIIQFLSQIKENESIQNDNSQEQNLQTTMQSIIQNLTQIKGEKSLQNPNLQNKLNTIIQKISEIKDNKGLQSISVQKIIKKVEKQVTKVEKDGGIDEKQIVEEISTIWKTIEGTSKINDEVQIDKKTETINETNSADLQTKKNKESMLSFQQNELQQLKRGIVNLNQAIKEIKAEKEDDKQKTLDANLVINQTSKIGDTASSQKTVTSTIDNNLKDTIAKQVMQPLSSFKLIQPEKIVLHLKPVDLGKVEVSVEKVNGEIHIKMKSENPEVQKVLNSMMNELKGELQSKATEQSQSQTNYDKQQEEKAKGQPNTVKNEDEEKEESENSFDEEFNLLTGGNRYGN